MGTSLQAVAAYLGFLCPEWESRACRLADRLADGLVRQPLRPRPYHGDFHPKQVLVDGDHIVILDLDEAAHGDSAADLGHFIAFLELNVLRGRLPRERAEQIKECFLAGYRQTGGQWSPERVQLHLAATLLTRARHPFRNGEPDWPQRMAELIGWAESLAPAARAEHSAAAVGPQVRVVDPFGSAADADMGFLAQALDPAEAWRQIRRLVPGAADREMGQHAAPSSADDASGWCLRSIRVARYKPGRRCLIEYELERPGGKPGNRTERSTIILVGKAKARGMDEATHRLMHQLRGAGFGEDSADGICVPEPLGMVREFQMCLYRKAPGEPVTQLLAGPDGKPLAARIAEGIYKLHQANVSCQRRHTIADELRILHDRLSTLALSRPQWAPRLQRLLADCDRLGAAIPEPAACGIHRDFYADHVLVEGPRLYLLDFDLYCQGDPGLDVGNFIGHLIEQSLRTSGNPRALDMQQEALVRRYVELSGPAVASSIDAYTTLTLVRHIWLSTQFPDRRGSTEALLELCEDRLAAAASRLGKIE
jgi:aminoglycoside phosphotransferase (APT) family kinase protein